MGADAAVLQGRMAARALARDLGLPPPDDVLQHRSDRLALGRLAALRRFLDRQYAPAAAFADPADDTVICRCEAVRAGEIRGLVRAGCMGPNQLRAFSRAGMGPCMGRMCGASIGRIMAAAAGRSIAGTGHFTVRPPLKPVTLGDLARLADWQRPPEATGKDE
jgi:bacterioferritin-associated ferredoxin